MMNKKISYPDFIAGRFTGVDVHIIASGPSLYGFDYSKFSGKRVIAVNHAWKLVEHDFCVFADRSFAQKESPGVTDATTCLSFQYPDVDSIQFKKNRNRFSPSPDTGVYTPRSSGCTALSVALQGSAKNIFLWGFDCRFFSPEEMIEVAEENGATEMPTCGKVYGHSTAEKFLHMREDRCYWSIYNNMIELFSVFPRQNIYNMSRWSDIPYFDKLRPSDVLNNLAVNT